jgi:hypothetical protein
MPPSPQGEGFSGRLIRLKSDKSRPYNYLITNHYSLTTNH